MEGSTKIQEGKNVKRHSERAERSYLGAVLLDLEGSRDALELGLDRLKNGHLFYYDSHRKIWEAIVDLVHSQEEVDSVSVAERLEERNELDDVGGASYLAGLMNACPSPNGADNYLEIIEEKFERRELERSKQEIDPYDDSKNPKELAEKAIENLERAQDASDSAEIEKITEGFAKLYEKIEVAEQEGLMDGAIRTGFSKLTRRIKGIMPNDFLIASGQTGVGKTTFALQMAHHIAGNEDQNVLIYSGEMQDYEISLKLASKSGVSLDSMMEGEMSDEDWERIANLEQRLYEQGLFTMMQNNPTVGDFKAAVRKADRKHGIDFVVLDYLQYLNNHDRSNLDEREFLDYASSQITNFCNSKDIPILAISRLNRQGKIHGSGKPEYDCNYHLMIKDPEPDVDEHPQKRILEMDKTRFGNEKDIRMWFHGEYSQFIEEETRQKIKQEGGNSTDYGQIWGY